MIQVTVAYNITRVQPTTSMCVVVLFLNLQKNTQLIDSKNKQVLPSTRDESSIQISLHLF